MFDRVLAGCVVERGWVASAGPALAEGFLMVVPASSTPSPKPAMTGQSG